MRFQHRITIIPDGELLHLKQDLRQGSRPIIQMRYCNKLSRKKKHFLTLAIPRLAWAFDALYGFCSFAVQSMHACQYQAVFLFYFFFLPFSIHNTTRHSTDLSPWSRRPSAAAMKAERLGRQRQQQTALKSVDFIWQEITAGILFVTRCSSPCTHAVRVSSWRSAWSQDSGGGSRHLSVVCPFIRPECECGRDVANPWVSWWSAMLRWGSSCFWARGGAGRGGGRVAQRVSKQFQGISSTSCHTTAQLF